MRQLAGTPSARDPTSLLCELFNRTLRVAHVVVDVKSTVWIRRRNADVLHLFANETNLVKRDSTVGRYFRYRTWISISIRIGTTKHVATDNAHQLPGVFSCEGVQSVATFRHTVVHRQRRVLPSAPAGRAYRSTGSRWYDVTDGLRRGNPFCRRSAADSRTVVLACYFRLLLLPLRFS